MHAQKISNFPSKSSIEESNFPLKSITENLHNWGPTTRKSHYSDDQFKLLYLNRSAL